MHRDSNSIREVAVARIDWAVSDEVYTCTDSPDVFTDPIATYPSARELGLYSFDRCANYPDNDGDSLCIEDGTVTGHYRKRLDINKIHKGIIKHADKLELSIPEMRDQLTDIDNMVDQGGLTGSQLTQLIRAKQSIKESINEILGGSMKNGYIKMSADILTRYNMMNLKQEEVDFFEPNDKLTKKDVEVNSIIEEYLDIASEFVDINVVREVRRSSLCYVCGYDLSDSTPDADGTFNCLSCGIEIEYIDKESINMREGSSNRSSRNNYEDRINFTKALTNYQGKQDPKLPENLCRVLDEYFTLLGVETGGVIRARAETGDNPRDSTNLNMMLLALKKTGLSSYYEDVNLIMHRYWGWKLPDVSHLEEKIMEDYDKSQEVFLRVKEKGRKSCLNAQYRLYRHLERLGHKCSAHDFKIVGTLNTLRFHELSWEKICRTLDSPSDRWVYRSII